MQATKEITEVDKAQELWLKARDEVVRIVEEMMKLGVHKQTINRMLEPWIVVPYILTSDNFDQMYFQRFHPDAQPEFVDLVTKMIQAQRECSFTILEKDQWHLPFVLSEERSSLSTETLLKISAARCARVSYFTHGTEKVDREADIRLFESLVSSDHWSPLEHQATPAPNGFGNRGNFANWIQHRKLYPGEKHAFDEDVYLARCKLLGIEPSKGQL